MSRPELDELLLRIEFNDQGVPVGAVRECRGCGGASTKTFKLDPNAPYAATIRDAVSEHLGHCDKGHGLRPKVMCGLVVTATVKYRSGDVGREMRCTKEKHPASEEHEFRLKIQSSR